ncbi:MAG TPA: phosphoenolpyruvate synthase, partial [Candidatus Nesterenkonia stercoripullorum]|nr:phosphoenolpyruvate synthase [Candidatus Nesterenkonia stercoripullorum]
MSRTIAFTHEDASRLDVAGGKGASLARSARALPVPPGLIVTSEAYRAFLEPLEAAIAALLDEAESADQAAAPIQDLILGVEPDHEWMMELEDSLTRHDLARYPLAVRSSGTMEDLPGAAFAGQHDTFLGERGATAVA